MADKNTARTAFFLTGAAVGGYFLWKFLQGSGGTQASSQTFSAETMPTDTVTPIEKKHTMTHILHLDSSARGSSSHSRTVSGELVAALKAADPSVTVTYRDLGHEAIPYVSETLISAMYTPAEMRTAEQNAEIALSDQLVAELAAADVYVFGIPMYNFSVPGVFKSYIDQVVRPGVTFDPATYQGLLLNKKAFVITARGGGGYGPGEAREAYNVQDPVVKNAFGLMGVTDIEFIHVNNTARGEDVVNGALAEAREKIASLVQAM
jgi:FMN-dependent NADH-azoreductase